MTGNFEVDFDRLSDEIDTILASAESDDSRRQLVKRAFHTFKAERLSRDHHEQKFLDFLNAAPTTIWYSDREGKTRFVNKHWFDYTGQEFQLDDTGRAWSNGFHPEDIERARTELTAAFQKNLPLEHEFRVWNASAGEYRWHLARARQLFDRDGDLNSWVGSITDIQPLKDAEEAIRYAKGSAEAASRMKSEFLANMSHEIRTPMTAVLGFAELLKDSTSEDERADYIGRIENSGRNLLQLIDDILDISKIEAGKMKVQRRTFSPYEIARDVVADLSVTADKKGLELKLDASAVEGLSAECDPARIRQVLLNLVGNAIKFTARGEIVVSVGVQLPNCLIFEVSDTGIGIAPSLQQKLFKPFAQADSSISRTFGGTGLGLHLSRRLCQQLGGSLEIVESIPGSGSRFAASFSAAPLQVSNQSELSCPAAASSEASDLKTLESLRILLVEDVPDNQVLMKRYLQSSGALVQIASNGEEAIHACTRGTYDVVLMDIQMPKLDGIAATKILRKVGFTKPIIALSAHAMTDEVERSLSAGCNLHINKPVTRHALLSAISEIVIGF